MKRIGERRGSRLNGGVAASVGIGMVALTLILLQAQADAGWSVAMQLDQSSRDRIPSAGVSEASFPTSTVAGPVRNGGFEADWSDEMSHWVKVFPVDGEPYLTELGEFHTPPGWLSWFRHDPGTWDQPEVGDIRAENVPYRVRSGEKAARLFTFYRSHDAGFMQQIPVTRGWQLTLTAHAHAWSNHPITGHEGCTDDGLCSAGVGRGGHFLLPGDVPPLTGDPWNDAVGNFAFTLGIDPTGGTDPFAETVEWGTTAYIYNEYHQAPPVSVRAKEQTATIFLRSQTLWAFKHNDAYWDDVELTMTEGYRAFLPLVQMGSGSFEWSYPVITRGSKIGIHGMTGGQWTAFPQQLVDAGTRFPVVKTVDHFGWVFDVAEDSPDTIFVGRRVWPGEGCGGVEHTYYNYQNQAEQAISLILQVIDLNPGLEDIIDYWEPYNEPDPPGAQGYRRLSELMMVTMDVAEEHDLKLALFSLNTGTPEWDEMEAMVETGVFSRARAGGHVLAVHEGTLDTHDPTSGHGSTIPGSPIVPGAGALNFRYRYLYHLLEQRGEVVPLVVSEWYCGDEQEASIQTLMDALEWYDGLASDDYYFLGALPFTLGPTSQWLHTDYERVYPSLINYMIDIKDRENALPSGRLSPQSTRPKSPGRESRRR